MISMVTYVISEYGASPLLLLTAFLTLYHLRINLDGTFPSTTLTRQLKEFLVVNL